MHHKILGVLVGMFLVIGILAPHHSQAQDNSRFTEEEIAAIEQILAIYDLKESYHSYAIHDLEYDRIGFKYDSADSSYLTQIEKSYDTNGYTLRNENEVNGVYDVSLTYSDVRSAKNVDETSDNPTVTISPYQTTEYTMEGKIIALASDVYVNVAYTDATEDVSPLEEGWVVIDSIEAIPEAYNPLNLAEFLKTTPSDFFEKRDALFTYVSSVEIEQSQTNTGTGLEMVKRITINIQDENFEPYFREVYGDVFFANSVWAALMSEPDMHGDIIIIADITEQGNLFFFQMLMTIDNQDLDADKLFPNNFEEGTTVSWSISINKQQYLTNINGEFDPIIAPE